MTTVVEFSAEAHLTWLGRKSKDGGWVAFCRPLQLVVQAETWDELQNTADEVVQHLLLTVMKDGTIVRFLQEHGWSPVSQIPAKVPEGGIRFDLPLTIERERPAHAHPT